MLSSKAQSDNDLKRSRLEAMKIIHALHKAQDKMDELEVRERRRGEGMGGRGGISVSSP